MTGILTTIIPARAGADGWPVLSAVRCGIGANPVEYIAIVDCGEGTPIHPYATVHLHLWPDKMKASDGQYNLTWQQARANLAERAGLIPVSRAEVVIFAREPYAEDDTVVFIDGQPADAHHPPVMVTTRVVYLDIHDEQDWWMAAALRDISDLSPPAQQRITDEITRIATERGIDLDTLAADYDKLRQEYSQ
jgi:hypothetical protein